MNKNPVGSCLSPGYYNPKYDAIDQHRGDKKIISWDRKLQPKVKFDVTKIIRKKED